MLHFSKSNLDLEIEVPDVAGIWLHAEHSGDLIALLAGQVVVKVEHRLLPVGVPDKIRCAYFPLWSKVKCIQWQPT